jgi:transmembrane sensor
MDNNYQPYFDIAALIAKYMGQGLNDQEKAKLEEWLSQSTENVNLFDRLTAGDITAGQLPIASETKKEQAWQNIVQKTGIEQKQKKTFDIKRWGAYAAAILIPLTIGIAVINNVYKNKKKSSQQEAVHQRDILPGGNKAVLTLANGSKILLGDAGKGKIANQQEAVISKTLDGKVVYTVVDSAVAIEKNVPNNIVATNTITTPRGGQYQVELADGTRVWLNAASSLTYPVAFKGNKRIVTLTGEAYFDVAKNAAKPFYVQTNTQTVQVLGTHFNINSYTDEQAVKTTLLEGSVKITGKGKVVMLTPGQQAINSGAGISVVRDADVDEAVAWKNGKFLFNNTDLITIMRQLSRWYDVDVEYQGSVAGRHYEGRISRNVPVSQIFQILKTSGLNFTINGRKIIVKS